MYHTIQHLENAARYGCFETDTEHKHCVLTCSGSAGGSEGVPGEGDGGQAEADGDHQRHTEPAALSHAEGESRVQPGAGRPAGERSAR